MMDIIEGNKLIHEFMGGEPDDIHFPFLQYDCEWNEIMKVIEKIESLDNKIFAVHLFFNVAEIKKLSGHPGGVLLFRSSGETKIEAAWKVVLQFIKSSTSPNNGE